MPDHPNEIEAVPELDPVVTIVVGYDLVAAAESLQEGFDVGAGLIFSHEHSDPMVTPVRRGVRAKTRAVVRVCPFEKEWLTCPSLVPVSAGGESENLGREQRWRRPEYRRRGMAPPANG